MTLQTFIGVEKGDTNKEILCPVNESPGFFGKSRPPVTVVPSVRDLPTSRVTFPEGPLSVPCVSVRSRNTHEVPGLDGPVPGKDPQRIDLETLLRGTQPLTLSSEVSQRRNEGWDSSSVKDPIFLYYGHGSLFFPSFAPRMSGV